MYRQIPLQPIVREALQKAIDRTLDGYKRRVYEQEPQITERMAASIGDALHDIKHPDISFSVDVISFADRGRGSEEARYGADFAGLLILGYQDRTVKKVFLSQAKLGVVESGSITLGNLNTTERHGLLEQSKKMLSITPESYVAIYTRSGFRFVPAQSIIRYDNGSDHESWHHFIQPMPVFDPVDFYLQYFNCYVGDNHFEKRLGQDIQDVENFKAALSIIRPRTTQVIQSTINQPFSKTDNTINPCETNLEP